MDTFLFELKWKKWTIIVLISTLLMVKLISTYIAFATIDSFINELEIYLDIIATKTTAFIVLIIFNTISLSITLIGLFGAIFEHYCSSIIFTILYSFTLVGVICELFKNSNYIYEFFLVFLLYVAEISFIIDLRQRHLMTTIKTKISKTNSFDSSLSTTTKEKMISFRKLSDLINKSIVVRK